MHKDGCRRGQKNPRLQHWLAYLLIQEDKKQRGEGSESTASLTDMRVSFYSCRFAGCVSYRAKKAKLADDHITKHNKKKTHGGRQKRKNGDKTINLAHVARSSITVALSSFPECPSASFGSHPTSAATGFSRPAARAEKRLLMTSSAFRILSGRARKEAAREGAGQPF